MDKFLNLPGLAYSLYQNKNREVPMELYDKKNDNNKEPIVERYGFWEDLKAAWNKLDAVYIWTALAIFLIVYLVLLYYAIQLAFKMARSDGELVLHIGFAILNPMLYLFIALASQVWHYGGMGGLVA